MDKEINPILWVFLLLLLLSGGGIILLIPIAIFIYFGCYSGWKNWP